MAKTNDVQRNQLSPEAHLAAIVSSSADGIISKDLNGIIQSWNPAAEQLFGWTAEEMIGSTIRRLIPEDRQSEEDNILSAIGRGERVPRFETWRLNKSGHHIPVAVTVSPVRDDNGHIVGASKIVSDLREHHFAKRELSESEDRFRAMADNIPQLAWMADGEGWIFWYNQRWFDLTGTTLDEMEGWGWRKVHHPNYVEGVTKRFAKAIDLGTAWEDTFPLKMADGSYRWFLSRARPVRDNEGNVSLWFGTNTDVTQQREHEKQIEILMREVNHRARNNLSILQSVIHRTARDVDPTFIETLDRRITALSNNQELLDRRGWLGASVGEIIRHQLEFLEGQQARISLNAHCDDLVLRPAAAEALGLAIHELATNALKHGALANQLGAVRVTCNTDQTGPGVLQISWEENGGPSVRQPEHEGFGSLLIGKNLETSLGAKIVLKYAPEGLTWKLSAPLDQIEANL